MGFIVLTGCNANAWMGDPTANGYYKPTPTTIPILDRIDIIEEHAVWPQVTKVGPGDLAPSDLEYRIHPGDALEVEIYGLYSQGQRYPVQRVVDQGGYFRVPEVGDVLVAGLTPQAAQDKIEKALSGTVLSHPSVQVNLLNQTGFRYTVYGGLSRWGVFSLSNPNLRLVDVLALAGGVPQATKKIHVIRQLAVSDTMLSSWDRENNQSTKSQSSKPKTDFPTKPTTPTAPSIEDLINQLDTGGTQKNAQEPAKTPESVEQPNQQIQDLIQELDIGDTTETDGSSPMVSPGVLQTGDHAVIDVDDLVPPNKNTHQPVDVDDLDGKPSRGGTSDAAYIYVPENDSWISVSTDPLKRTNGKEKSSGKEAKHTPKVLERIIVIPWDLLRQGDSSYNIVIRPDDRIYVEPPELGNLYIRGEINRPGVFSYPNTGEKITLSEFITSAGDLGPIAVPERVSLTRRIGNMQATVTLNYAAILQRTEPDIFLKPNDHISIGTSWGATPMAIIRNGFRATYGFGFLLDRNFGNDVFGRAP
ncbi:MAG: polysaccharide biosynthesis/export family protein [Planctomycetes bacterium]|nr:polysaccharide biosynthesis/export family protein [Planctomycetota bacterium]